MSFIDSRGPLGLSDGTHVRVTLTRSLIGRIPKHRATVAALGLRGIGSSAEHVVSASTIGMIRKVGYLLSVEEIL